MAEQDNVETNPVLAVGLAGVALIGVLGSFLPPGLVDRMNALNQSSTSEPVSLETTQQAASIALHQEEATAEALKPASVTDTEDAGVTFERDLAVAPAQSAGASSASEDPTSTVVERSEVEEEPKSAFMPEARSQNEETGTSTPLVGSEKQQPAAQVNAWQRPQLPPEPVYRPVPSWGGYPAPAYPPVYSPYYGQPPYGR